MGPRNRPYFCGFNTLIMKDIDMFFEHYLVFAVFKPLPSNCFEFLGPSSLNSALDFEQNKTYLFFASKCSFAAVQQTSTAELPVFFQRF